MQILEQARRVILQATFLKHHPQARAFLADNPNGEFRLQRNRLMVHGLQLSSARLKSPRFVFFNCLEILDVVVSPKKLPDRR
jgi:hypothetical protein